MYSLHDGPESRPRPGRLDLGLGENGTLELDPVFWGRESLEVYPRPQDEVDLFVTNSAMASGLLTSGDLLPFGLNSYLVDPASSHMLVSKIKPCMSKYKQIHTVKLRMAH